MPRRQGGASPRRVRHFPHVHVLAPMALNKEFYASMFAASARAHAAPSAAPATVAPFAAHAKKEFDMTSFLKDLAAVRDAMRCDDARLGAYAMRARAVRRRRWMG